MVAMLEKCLLLSYKSWLKKEKGKNNIRYIPM